MINKIRSFYPTLGMSWATVAVFISCTFIITIPLSIVAIFSGNPDLGKDPWVMFISYVLPFLLTACFIYATQRYAVPEETTNERKPLPLLLFGLLLLFVPLISLIVEPLTAWLPMPQSLQEMFAQMFKVSTPAFLMTVIAAPLCEEWLCRGVIMRGLLKHSTPTKAILWSAFIFAIIHINPWQAVPAFAIGLVLGYVYWKTQSLIPCIFIHFVNNGLSFLIIYCYPEMDINTSSQDLLGNYYWPAYTAALLLATALGYALYHLLNKENRLSTNYTNPANF